MRDLSDEALLDLIQHHNTQYRAGEPEISDAEYDALVAELANRQPDHPFLHTVEPEPVNGQTIRLPEKMLSTQKAYTLDELKKWYANVQEVAASLGINQIEVRVTPKLDGFAAQVWHVDEIGAFLATRGDGEVGQDVTRAIERGLSPCRFGFETSTIVEGPGEIVVDKKYFEEHLSQSYENTRNVIAAVLKPGELDPLIQQALRKEAIVFAPFNLMPGFQMFNFESWLTEFGLDQLWEHGNSTKFNTDGIVIEVTAPQLKAQMGSTSHHHRWQIAYKRNTEFHDCKVTDLVWQTSRNGRITPVVLIEPTRIHDVTVSRVTGHHAGNIIENGIGKGAVVKVTRSGQVIPHIVEVVTPRNDTNVVTDTCPSCGEPTTLVGDNLLCENTATCPAQMSGQLEHFCKTLGIDGFGPAVCDVVTSSTNFTLTELVSNYRHLLPRVVSSGIAENLIRNIEARLATPVEPWRILAAFGMRGMGRSMCEKILDVYPLKHLFGLIWTEITAVQGFGPTMATNLEQDLDTIREDFLSVLTYFKLDTQKSETTNSVITGKTIVFTGTMVAGSRSDMEAQAKQLGAKVGSSVSSKTDLLVYGENVGANKTQAAADKGVKTMSEQEYLAMLETSSPL